MNITPKETANRLNKVYKSYLPSGLEPDLFNALGKKFTLLCVDEILKARSVGKTGVILDKEYWEEVKFELERI